MGSSTEHPLMQREWTYIRDYGEWCALVDKAEYVEQLYGLLHIGFKVSASYDEARERIIRYLEYADGHLGVDTFQTPEERQRARYSGPHSTPLGIGWPSGTLHVVAQKAFKILCRDFFGNPERKDYQIPGVNYRPSWDQEILYRPVLEKVLWFLRLDESPIRTRRLRNLKGYSDYEREVGKHYLKVGENFAYDLAQYIFRRSDECSDAYRELLNEFKPAAVDILYSLGKLDILLHDDYPSRMDQRCLLRMQELAMREQIYTGGDLRAVESLGEACLAESQAAKILLLLGIMRQTQERLDHIQELQQQCNDARHQLEQLTGNADQPSS
jgi:hypothetical protein